MVVVAAGCGRSATPAVSADGGPAARAALTTTATTTPSPVRAALSCKTSRFPWARTPSTAGARADEPHEHDHGRAELVLPLVLGRSRCPSRGHVLVRVTTPADSGAHVVEVEGLGPPMREVVMAGRDVALVSALPLAGVGAGVHRLVVRVDGRPMVVPAVEVTP